ncbi:MAG TPA: TetR/AcrR family transcriptional regulator [Nocardioidaceae bacterium]|nr:TetR/AcrR family transcriptional regulator [Nocardioidaceae bacterium]
MPRAGLSTETVVAEAARLVDEPGTGRLTLAGLAKRFGVALPSLYKHVDGLEDLHGRLAVRVAVEVGDAMRRAATGKASADALRAVAAAYRDYAHHHPGGYGYLLRAPAADNAAHVAAATEILDVLDDVFAGYGITGDDAVDAARLVRSALHGFVSLEVVGGFGMPHSVDRSFDRVVDALDHALDTWSAPASR